MNQRLSLPLAIALALGTTNAWALGLGPIEVHSGLNQPLVADIPITESTPDEAAALKVQLATAEEFNRVGADLSALHAPLDFQLLKDARGRSVIHVTSEEPIKEPVLGFLISADWSKGRMLREYSVLLDPPVVAPAIVNAPATPIATAAPEPVPARTEPMPQSTSAPVAVAAAPSTSSSSSAPSSSEPPKIPGGSNAAPGEYGPVATGETLWEIANATKPDASVDVNQMMVAIQKANPNAFSNNNVNQLKRGAILRIPGVDEIRATSPSAARAEIAAQSNAPAPVPTPTTRPTVAETASPTSTKSSSTKSSSSTPSDAHLSVLPPSDGSAKSSSSKSGVAGGTDTSAAAQAELKRKEEELKSRDSQITDLKSRLTALESIKTKSEALIDAKNSEIAELNRQLKQMREQAEQQKKELDKAKANGASASPSASSATPSSSAAPSSSATSTSSTSSPLTPPSPNSSTVLPSSTTSPNVPSSSASTPTSSSTTAPSSSTTPESSSSSTPPDGSSSSPTSSTTPPSSSATAPASSSSTTPSSSSSSSTTAPAPSPEAATTSPIEPVQEEVPIWKSPWVAVVGLGIALLGGVMAVGLLRKKKPSAGAPLAPAAPAPYAGQVFASADAAMDEHQVTGNDAEHQLLQQLAGDPTDLDSHLDLLRHYYSHSDVDKFEAAAEAMFTQVSNPAVPAWQRASEMGRELAPHNNLFEPYPTETTPEPYVAPPVRQEWDFDMAARSPAPAPAPAYEPTLEFAAPPAPPRYAEPAPMAEPEGFDFNLVDEPKVHATHVTEPDLPSLELTDTALPEPMWEPESLPPPVRSAPAPAPRHDYAEANSPPENFLVGEDAVRTKLDLARAYLDMGDAEGARSMLQEVLGEGSSHQQEEARRMLAEVG